MATQFLNFFDDPLATQSGGTQYAGPVNMNLPEEQMQLEQFGEIVLADRSRHDQLRRAKDEGEFIGLVIQWAAERGYHFTAATVQRTLNEKRRAWLERWM